MKKTIYKELIFIFIGVLLFSNIITAFFVAQSFEYTTVTDMRNSLISSVEDAKEIYTEYNISQEDLNDIFKDKTIPIRFVNNIEGYNLTNEQEELIMVGESILIDSSDEHQFPIAITKADDFYILADISGHSIFVKVRDIIVTNSYVAIILGSLIFMIVGKMIIKPVNDITNATRKVATGDFNVVLKNNRNDELGELIESFNKMTKELGSIEILRNDFVSDISHEFKTPITSIEGYTKLLIDCSDEDRVEYIDIILRETKRLSTMAINILTINKLDNEGIYNTEEFRLDEQIRKSILLLENKWSSKDLDLDVELDETNIKGNPSLITQIWINLLDNAIKFSPNGKTIKIRLTNNKNICEFSIEDEGPGISLEDKNRIFDKFYKGDKSRNKEGTGLGLSIVKKIIDLHGGNINVESEGDIGTKIVIILNKGL